MKADVFVISDTGYIYDLKARFINIEASNPQKYDLN